MSRTESKSEIFKGLWKDPDTGHYRVQSGYEHLAHRYRIHESWLDEDDNLWIDASGVERLSRQALDSGQSDWPGAA